MVNTVECSNTRKQTFRLHHLTDTHFDDPDHADRELRARIQQIKDDPNSYWVGGGDYGSLILPSDKRFATAVDASVHRLPDVYLEACYERFQPIAHKCLGLGIGNHEEAIGKHYHRGVGAELAMRMGVPEKYLGTRGWSVIRFRQNRRVVTVKCYQFHGWSAGRLKGRKALQAERDVGAWRADVFLLGHDHQPSIDVFWTQECYDSKGGYKLRNRPVAVLNGGAWTYGQRTPAVDSVKKTRKASEWPNETWAESKNFRPQPPASPVLDINVDFGTSASKEGRQAEASGFSFEARMLADWYDV